MTYRNFAWILLGITFLPVWGVAIDEESSLDPKEGWGSISQRMKIRVPLAYAPTWGWNSLDFILVSNFTIGDVLHLARDRSVRYWSKFCTLTPTSWAPCTLKLQSADNRQLRQRPGNDCLMDWPAHEQMYQRAAGWLQTWLLSDSAGDKVRLSAERPNSGCITSNPWLVSH